MIAELAIAEARLVPLENLEQLQQLHEAAASDQHTVVVPTHLVMKGEEVVGYGSIGAVPCLNVWVHSQKVNKFESLRLLSEAEQMLRTGGAQFVIMPVSEDSPFRKFITRLGYQTLGSASYNIKKL